MPPRDWRLRVADIIAAVGRIGRFAHGLTFEQFAADEKTVAAVSYEFLVIGEAANAIPDNVRAKSGNAKRGGTSLLRR